ncbi:hypothetical protein EVAR_66082_1 [Eumeta japonica]|uniref:Uncharacterized protein n=1 Tax=Eumeta variegata TaxID=151549 RepID=A0A4C2A5B3_EUMVA|nr:hypothetical protein EVAR_66082_1 [Eumeta japonica]
MLRDLADVQSVAKYTMARVGSPRAADGQREACRRTPVTSRPVDAVGRCENRACTAHDAPPPRRRARPATSAIYLCSRSRRRGVPLRLNTSTLPASAALLSSKCTPRAESSRTGLIAALPPKRAGVFEPTDVIRR